MITVEKLQSLSNAELRAKCIENGLPNVPVTETSRKVLIKKLVSVLNNESLERKKQNRRQTIGTQNVQTVGRNDYYADEAKTANVFTKPLQRKTIDHLQRPSIAVKNNSYGKLPNIRTYYEYSAQEADASDDNESRNSSLSSKLGRSEVLTTSFNQEIAAHRLRDAERRALYEKPYVAATALPARASYQPTNAHRSYNNVIAGAHVEHELLEDEAEIYVATDSASEPEDECSSDECAEQPFATKYVHSRETTRRPLARIKGRQTYSASQESIYDEQQVPFLEAVKTLIITLDKQYHLKHSFVLVSIFVLSIFIYVFFIQKH